MSTLDFVVLGVYFGLLVLIGVLCSFAIRKQEDYFLGGRTFGKLLQTFASFGAGTGSQDPINVGGRTWTSGLSGIWAALCWLLVTPFYWIFAVWYRRMRHLTLGDWFVERYQSRSLGVAYTIFAFSFQILYLSVMFSAISKFVEPLMGEETTLWLVSFINSTNPDDLKFVIVPLVALAVIVYGILGGLSAAYWTDLIQGLGIIVLSIILIPYGLQGLVDTFGTQYPELQNAAGEVSTIDGFTIMHDRLQPDHFALFDTPQAGEFPLHYIIALVLVSLIGIVIQPHFIATGGGSAKTELSARVGLVSGNFLKRLCTIGWALTGLIALALFAGNQEIAQDPDRVWGVASREILAPLGLGLVGLMMACLIAALMSSADTYMLVGSALFVRNVYAAYVDPNASEKTYVTIGRVAGIGIIVGAVLVSVSKYNVLDQYLMALEVAAAFAAPFWLGMYWRRASTIAAWITVGFAFTILVVAPIVWPMIEPELRTQREFLATSGITETVIEREATRVDVEKAEAKRAVWDVRKRERDEAIEKMDELVKQKLASEAKPRDLAFYLENDKELAAAQERMVAAENAWQSMGARPELIALNEKVPFVYRTGGNSVFWAQGIYDATSDKAATNTKLISETKSEDGVITRRYEYTGDLKGKGRFNVEMLPYYFLGVDFSKFDDSLLKTLRLPPKILGPFLVMILISLITPSCKKLGLDRYYAKMKIPVDPDPEQDQANLEAAYANPNSLEHRKLFPGSNWEILRPRWVDILGFVISVAICFLFIQLILWMASLGA